MRRVRSVFTYLVLAMLAALPAESGSLRVVDMDFSGMVRATVVLFESEALPGDFLMAEADLPKRLLDDEALSSLPRQSASGCEQCLRLSSLGDVRFNERTASAQLLVHPRLLPEASLSMAPSARRFRPQNNYGLQINWGLRGAEKKAADQRTLTGAADLGLVASLGGGAVLRHDAAWLEDRGWLRGSSSLEYVVIEHRLEVVLGDAVTASGPLSSAQRFAGLSLRRRFDTQPGQVITPAYDLATVSRLPGVAELFIDGERTRRENVAAGRVRFEDIRGDNGSNVTLRFTDELGVVQEVSARLLGTTQMLGRGQLDFDLGAGLLREDSNRYEGRVGAAGVRFGLLNWLNVEGLVEAVDEQLNAGLGVMLATPVAQIELSASQNYYPDDLAPSVDDRGEGRAYTWSVSNSAAMRSPAVVFGYSGRYVEGFRRLGSDEAVASFQRFFAATRLGNNSLGGSLTRVDGRHSGALRLSRSIGGWGLSLGASAVEGEQPLYFASLAWSPRRSGTLRSLQYGYANGVEVDTHSAEANFYAEDQRFSANLRHQSVFSELGRLPASERNELELAKRWRTVNAGVQYRSIGKTATSSARVSGGLALTSGGAVKTLPPFTSQAGYLEVTTGLAGVSVDYGEGGVTADDNGTVVIPAQGFRPTNFAIDLDSLPDGYTTSHQRSDTVVVPGTRGIVEVVVAAPGFLLRIDGAKSGDTVNWNGRDYPVFGVGSYIENGHAGVNELVWQGKEHRVTLPRIGNDIPEFVFDAATGA
ncbi:hypothetical protein, partial [Spongiibacter marinus]|uniref:hypothetical protein n=1 Tax=Spongiibacter marinus TaxID=354246 RepID=UPI003C605A14